MEYRQSGEMETAVLALWKPLPQGLVPAVEQRSQSDHSLRLLSRPYTSRMDR